VLDDAFERKWIQLGSAYAMKDRGRLSYRGFLTDVQSLLKQLR